mmetsp:Transcript_101026/g.290727  ORF Transcript_101026/g.290727 Transcript_101026/m.290727 type:complete len:396 (-) Transcript_101026:21-1208(-)
MQPEQVVADKDLARDGTPRADADDRDIWHRGLHQRPDLQRHALDDEEHRAGIREHSRILHQLMGATRRGALQAQAALERGALGLQTNVAHDRDAGVGHRPDQRRHVLSTLQLDHLGARHTESRCVLQTIDLGEERAERHVPDEYRLRTSAMRFRRQRGVNPATRCGGSAQHVVHCDAHRVGKTQTAIPQAVPDEDDVHARPAGDAGGREVVSGDHGQLVTVFETACEAGQAQRTPGGSSGSRRRRRGTVDLSASGRVGRRFREQPGSVQMLLECRPMAAAPVHAVGAVRLGVCRGVRDAQVCCGAERAPRAVQQEPGLALRPCVEVCGQVAQGGLHGDRGVQLALWRLHEGAARYAPDRGDESHARAAQMIEHVDWRRGEQNLCSGPFAPAKLPT